LCAEGGEKKSKVKEQNAKLQFKNGGGLIKRVLRTRIFLKNGKRPLLVRRKEGGETGQGFMKKTILLFIL